MNFYKVLAIFAVLLSLCNYEAEGGLTLLLLLKLVALKGALFLGAPLAFGSFLLGQGIGFLGGTVLGGYTVLGAANKLQKKQKAAAEAAKAKPATVVVNQGWGAAPVGTVKPVVVKQIVKATSSGWGWKGPKKPSLLARLTGIPRTIITHYTRPKHHHHKKPAVLIETTGWGWPAPSHDHHHHHHHDHGHAHDHAHAHDLGWTDSHTHDLGWNDAHTHDLGWTDSHSNGHGHSDVHAHAHSHGYSDGHSHDQGWVETKSVPEGWGWGPEGEGSEWATAVAESQGYSTSPVGSGYSAGSSSGRSISGGNSKPNSVYGPPPTSSSSSSGGYKSSPASEVSEGYERRSGEATEQIENYLPAPSSGMEEYLETKLKEEIETTKSESRKKEATQLMALLREVYIQELANSVVGDESDGSTTKIPPFLPIPDDVPNSTSVKPEPLPVTTVKPPGKSRLRNPFNNSKFVPIMKTSFALREKGVHKNHKLTMGDSQALKTYTEDVKKFFLLVSLLDQDSCLQKMVCDVHAKSGDGKTLNVYENNIVSTFQVMSAVIPENSDDSTAPFRKAAKIGEISKSLKTCTSSFTTCTYSTEQIIKMGNQVSLNRALKNGAAGKAATQS